MSFEAPVAYPIDPTSLRRRPIHYLTATLIAKHLDVGRWSITARLDSHTAKINHGWRIVFDGGPLPGFGGTVDDVRYQIGDDSGATRKPPTVTLSGPDDMTLLEERFAYPDPANVPTAQAAAYDRRSGVASTVVRAYIRRNVGDLALAYRQPPSFSVDGDPVVGSNVRGHARFDPLLSEIVRPLAEKGNIRVWITSTTSGLRATHFAAVQTIGRARFSLALRNLLSIKYRLTAPKATYVIGGGRGEEDAREFVVQQDAAAIAGWRHIEGFFDYRSASDTDSGVELTDGTATRLAESAAVEQVDVVPIDTDRLAFGIDYQLGDKVKIEVGHNTNIVLTAAVREVEVTIERQSGRRLVKVVPKVGTLGATGLLPTTAALVNLASRVGRLERR